MPSLPSLPSLRRRPASPAGELPPETLGAPLDQTVIEELVPASAQRAPRARGERLLDVRSLRTVFATRDGVVKAVDGIDFHVDRGEIMGLVGESGCGKSVTALSILRLVSQPGRVTAGEVMFDGRDLLTLRGDEMRKLRGDRISMIFQQPTSSLNPVWDVGAQLAEVLEIHRNMKRRAARSRALDLLRMVGIPDPARRLAAYPHELSGGMAQRVMIAMALACEPELLIADEPTTALDVTIQAQILDLMRELRDRTGTAIILITHDLGVVAEMCDRVAVMYAGEIVEQADVRTLFRQPLHPYTRGLIASIPVVGDVRKELAVIPGNVPNLIDLPKGCRFAPRCAARLEHDVAIATEVHPNLLPIGHGPGAAPGARTGTGTGAGTGTGTGAGTGVGHEVRCWLYHDAAGNLSDLGREARAGRVGADRGRGGADPLAGAGQ